MWAWGGGKGGEGWQGGRRGRGGERSAGVAMIVGYPRRLMVRGVGMEAGAGEQGEGLGERGFRKRTEEALARLVTIASPALPSEGAWPCLAPSPHSPAQTPPCPIPCPALKKATHRCTGMTGKTREMPPPFTRHISPPHLPNPTPPLPLPGPSRIGHAPVHRHDGEDLGDAPHIHGAAEHCGSDCK